MDRLFLVIALLQAPQENKLWNFVNNFENWIRPNLEQAYFLIVPIIFFTMLVVKSARPKLPAFIAGAAIAGVFILKENALRNTIEFFAGFF